VLAPVHEQRVLGAPRRVEDERHTVVERHRPHLGKVLDREGLAARHVEARLLADERDVSSLAAGRSASSFRTRTHTGEQVLGGAALVRGDRVLVAVHLVHRTLEAEEAARADGHSVDAAVFGDIRVRYA
jgi:hypothetical protein